MHEGSDVNTLLAETPDRLLADKVRARATRGLAWALSPDDSELLLQLVLDGGHVQGLSLTESFVLFYFVNLTRPDPPLRLFTAIALRQLVRSGVQPVVSNLEAYGAHAQDIAAPAGVDPGITGLFFLTARILRLLATRHIFREVSPGVFKNNRGPSTLGKGKPSSTLFSNRAERLTGSLGIAALVENLADIFGKSAVYVSDSLLNPGKLPFNIAFRTDEAMFAWHQRPGNAYNVSRFTVAMRGTAATEPQDTLFQGGFLSILSHSPRELGFYWSALPPTGQLSALVVESDTCR
ncbi:hypothetical protein C8R47DRAFT_1189841 [Mycena vitilis]|nr:hypothetical protein C8R47DRAFT_1189841 [Mycena vitilis]